MIEAAPCPLCEPGKIGFRLCQRSETLVLICHECGFVWTHPSRLEASHAEDLLSPDFARRHPGLSVRPSRWATREEIVEKGWEVYLLTPGDLLEG